MSHLSRWYVAGENVFDTKTKDHTFPQNYHPISGINNDMKLFGRPLADKLSIIIPMLISPDQTDFISTRQITDNIRLATNIIQDANMFSKKVLLLPNLGFREHLCTVLGLYTITHILALNSRDVPLSISHWATGPGRNVP